MDGLTYVKFQEIIAFNFLRDTDGVSFIQEMYRIIASFD